MSAMHSSAQNTGRGTIHAFTVDRLGREKQDRCNLTRRKPVQCRFPCVCGVSLEQQTRMLVGQGAFRDMWDEGSSPLPSLLNVLTVVDARLFFVIGWLREPKQAGHIHHILIRGSVDVRQRGGTRFRWTRVLVVIVVGVGAVSIPGKPRAQSSLCVFASFRRVCCKISIARIRE